MYLANACIECSKPIYNNYGPLYCHNCWPKIFQAPNCSSMTAGNSPFAPQVPGFCIHCHTQWSSQWHSYCVERGQMICHACNLRNRRGY